MQASLSLMRRALRAFLANRCMSFAAAIAYYALFSLFPLVLVLLSFLGFFIHSRQQQAAIVDAVSRLLGEAVGRNALSAQVSTLAGGHGRLGVASLVVALWSASAVFGAIDIGLNAAWDVAQLRPFVARKVLDLALALGAGLLFLMSLAATGVLTAIEGFSGAILGSELGPFTHLLFTFLLLAVPPAISFVAFAFLYYVVPRAQIRLGDVWPGALAAALLFQAAQIGFGVYVANFAHYDRVYGSLGAVITFLFFVYISAIILLFGGVLTKEYAELRASRRTVAQRTEAKNGRARFVDRSNGQRLDYVTVREAALGGELIGFEEADPMKRDLMEILVCPLCKGPLELHVDEENEREIVTGSLTCARCNETYPISDTIPNLLPPELRKAAP